MTDDRRTPEKTITVYWLDGPRPFLPLLIRKRTETIEWAWEKPTLWESIKGWFT